MPSVDQRPPRVPHFEPVSAPPPDGRHGVSGRKPPAASIQALVAVIGREHPDTWCRVDYPGNAVMAAQNAKRYGAEACTRGGVMYIRVPSGGGAA